MQKLYIIRFGYQRDATGEPTGISQSEAAKAAERSARLTGIPPYLLRFSTVAWFNNDGAGLVEHGGEIEFAGNDVETEARRFATVLRLQLKQSAVTMRIQSVDSFHAI